MNFLLFKCAIVARTPLPPKKSATISLGLELAKIIRSINGYGFSVAYSTLLTPSTGYLEATANCHQSSGILPLLFKSYVSETNPDPTKPLLKFSNVFAL